MPALTLRTLNRELAEWQRRFRIVDWRIKLRWGTKRETKDNDGLCWWSAEEDEATVVLSKKAPDLRGTLVHELLHIILQGHKTHDGTYDEKYESGLNRITAALLGRE